MNILSYRKGRRIKRVLEKRVMMGMMLKKRVDEEGNVMKRVRC